MNVICQVGLVLSRLMVIMIPLVRFYCKNTHFFFFTENKIYVKKILNFCMNAIYLW